MRVLLMASGSRGGVEPLMVVAVTVAVRLRQFGADVRTCGCADVWMCTPPDFVELIDFGGLPPVRSFVKGALAGRTKVPAEGCPRAAAMTARTYEAVVTAAEGCDVILAAGLLPAAAGARTAAGRLGVPYVFVACFLLTCPRRTTRRSSGRAGRSRSAGPATDFCGTWTPRP
ncbi:hypothetical protein AB0E83_03355 [Streptomyces sp. NPDC035033]|uniref:hypothetical protein n=1 Tax=Streptomyces sp. NPDC035033 TaxID=3155368 RepID=UPI0033EA07CE